MQGCILCAATQSRHEDRRRTGAYAPATDVSLSSTSLSPRVHAQIASTVSLVLGLPATRVQTLSVREMFVLCQQHGFEVDITVEKPADLNDGELGLVAELDMAA